MMILTRAMHSEDIARVARIELESFSDPWSEKNFADSLGQSFSYCIVAQEDEEVLGYLTFYKNLDEGEILRIAVKKGHQRQGIGALLINKLHMYCALNGVKRVMLDVRKSNKKARIFYKKQGFVQDGMRKHFYTNPEEDAVLMSRRF